MHHARDVNNACDALCHVNEAEHVLAYSLVYSHAGPIVGSENEASACQK